MESGTVNRLNLPKITLGTAQFGQDYGIANRSGQPSYECARDIIACAYEGGVNCLDTAALYGESEEVLGRALSELGIGDGVTVVTKVTAIPEGLSPKDADAFVEQSVTRSLKRLRLETLPICLLHRDENINYLDSLLRLRDAGLVRHVGASVMTPECARRVVENDGIEALQIPTNILDRRFMEYGLTRPTSDKSIALFVRSIYLQGLILMPVESVPVQLAEVKPVIATLTSLAGEAGMTLAEMAMRYVMSLDGVTSVIVGVETVEQMRKNLAVSSKGPLDADLMARIEAAVPWMPDHVVMPTLWGQVR